MPSDHCPVLFVCDVDALWPNGWTDQDETWHAGRPRPGHTVLDGDSAVPTERSTAAPTFEIYGRRLCLPPYNLQSMSIVAQWLDGSRWNLAWDVGLGLRQIVLNGDPAHLPKGAQPPIFGHVCCGQMAGWIKMQLGTKVGLGWGHTVLDGDPAPLPQRGTAPQFLAHACCGKTAGWIKMPLGTEIDLGQGHIVLDGVPTRRGRAPNFRPMSIVAKRLNGSRCHLVRR